MGCAGTCFSGRCVASFISTGDDGQNPRYPHMRERISSINFFVCCNLCVYVFLRAITILNMKRNGLSHGEIGTLGF